MDLIENWVIEYNIENDTFKVDIGENFTVNDASDKSALAFMKSRLEKIINNEI